MASDRIGGQAGGTSTYIATANFANGQATGQGIATFDSYPGRWISVSVSGLGAGSAAAAFGVRFSNNPAAAAFSVGTLQDAAATSTATTTAITADTVHLHGAIKARYVQVVSLAVASAGTGAVATAFATVWDAPGQTIG